MKKTILRTMCFLLFAVGIAFAQENAPKHLKLQAVPFTAVQFDDHFWSPRLKTNREVSIPHNYDWCEKTGRLANFRNAADCLTGAQCGKFQGLFFNDSDVYKVIEGTAYTLASEENPALMKQADVVIDSIARSQYPNGYLNTYFTLAEPTGKWTNYSKHELYCAGHLFEGAIAYKQATGKDTLLNVAEKFADHIIDVFEKRRAVEFSVPGCELIEMALVRLYQETGKEKYIQLAKHFIDLRGDQSKRPQKIRGVYEQDHKPIRQQFEIVGHAVRACYLYSGVTGVAAHYNDTELKNALEHLWNDCVNKKMYITGGIGARHKGESFGEAYELPNKTAYCETCAAISLAFWAHRMNLLYGEAKYADVIERTIYNGILSGVSLDGKLFFYVNPLEADKEQSTGHDVVKNEKHHRQPFFITACCPTNIVRFLPSLPGYLYATQKNTVIVNQFMQSKASIKLTGGAIEIVQKTNYPWEDAITFELKSTQTDNTAGQNYVLKLRNGLQYEEREIAWNKTETFTIHRDVSIKRIIANPKVKEDNGRVALQRGMVVYCFEECDNETPVTEIKLAKNPEFKEEWKEIAGDEGKSVNVIVIKCRNVDGKELTAVPYYVWDNRAKGAMSVWVQQDGLANDVDSESPFWKTSSGEPILYQPLPNENKM
ncbi:MAG: glycoside hydrolase family 127 protein [Planctomycetaceae bacterium]|jgi:DUF1680 family protein|nr:glycoside hydrolase family 127 protein [Planctomycetaceae bacterium]